MAYNTTGTPRFWISTTQWLKSKGYLLYSNSSFGGANLNLFNVNPSITNKLEIIQDEGNNKYIAVNILSPFYWTDVIRTEQIFFMVLGHNFADIATRDVRLQSVGGSYKNLATTAVVNSIQNVNPPSHNGYSIAIGDNGGDHSDGNNVGLKFRFDWDIGTNNYNSQGNFFNIGSILYGNYYDMPHSANLDMSMSFVMDGIKTSETLGGSTLVHRNYTQAPMWGDLGAWELGKSENTQYFGRQAERDLGLQGLRKSGRRIWNLSFSYLQDQDVFPEISNLTNHEHRQPASGLSNNNTTPYDGDYYLKNEQDDYDPVTNTNLGFGGSSPRSFAFLNDASNKNFIAEVLHKTNGGALPFVFQPDSEDNTNFAIAIIDQNSISFKQVSNNLYDISMTIREVW